MSVLIDLSTPAATGSGPTSGVTGGLGYDETIAKVGRALHRRRPVSVALVGEPGVGLPIVVGELNRMATNSKAVGLSGKRFLWTDCRYVPPSQARSSLEAIINDAASKTDGVVCIDHFARLFPHQLAEENKLRLLAAVASGNLNVIGLLTPGEFDTLAGEDGLFQQTFQRIDVDEPTVESAILITTYMAAGVEARYEVAVTGDAIRDAVVLSANYVLNERLPNKAIEILQRACEEVDYQHRADPQSRERIVNTDDVMRVVSQVSRIPIDTLRGVADHVDYEASLRESILGQEHAVGEVATELKLIRAGMIEPNKPASVMLFIGQTGTGKTEMAKALAQFYSTSKRLRTYTLGNFVESHSVSGLIGVPAGYVGHEQGGRLINDLNADPFGVFLLDEADKAHPDVLQPLLNLFDEGWIVDQRGVKAYGNRSIFILTTNVGQRMMQDLYKQGKSVEEITSRMKESLIQIRHTKSNRPVFTPEFLARLKRVVVFGMLSREAMAGICKKLTRELSEDWSRRRQKRLTIGDEVVDFLADRSHELNEKSQGKEGGRIVRKLLADLVERRIQEEVARHPTRYQASAAMNVSGAVVAKSDDDENESMDIQVEFSD